MTCFIVIWLTSPLIVYVWVRMGTFAFYSGRQSFFDYQEKKQHGKEST